MIETIKTALDPLGYNVAVGDVDGPSSAGRKEGKYKSRKGNTKHYPSQRKRPFIHKTVADCEPEVIAEMQKIYDEEAEKM